MQYMGSESVILTLTPLATINNTFPSSGYLELCRSIVNCTQAIANAIKSSIPEFYILGSPPASVVAFASKHPDVNVLYMS